jgi:hypothetical protein
MDSRLTEAQWEELDAHILERSILLPLRLIREWTGVRLVEAMEIHYARYAQLREERPDDFPGSDKEYWEGVYS